MCFRDGFVLGDFDRDRDRRNRRERLICECREVDDRRHDRRHHCGCRECRRRRRSEFVCRCREI